METSQSCWTTRYGLDWQVASNVMTLFLCTILKYEYRIIYPRCNGRVCHSVEDIGGWMELQTSNASQLDEWRFTYIGYVPFHAKCGAPPWSSWQRIGPQITTTWVRISAWPIWRVFHLWVRFITFGGRSAHLADHVHKSGRKTLIIIIIIIIYAQCDYEISACYSCNVAILHKYS